jgi:hypothetical protein
MNNIIGVLFAFGFILCFGALLQPQDIAPLTLIVFGCAFLVVALVLSLIFTK